MKFLSFMFLQTVFIRGKGNFPIFYYLCSTIKFTCDPTSFQVLGGGGGG